MNETRQLIAVSDLHPGDEFIWQGARYRYDGPNRYGSGVDATHLFHKQTHILTPETVVERAPARVATQS